ncbi:MAG: hypothetical protein AB2697_19835 [Candidatus Thiodiazotropha endolucinida]
MRVVIFITIAVFSISINSHAQETFEMNSFIEDLNNAIKADINGVTVKGVIEIPSISNQEWLKAVAGTPQDYAVVAVDERGKPIELFGSSTPFEKQAGNISVPGYRLPQGGSYVTVGAAGWAKAASEIAAQNRALPAINLSIRKAITTISSATDYIAKELCSKRSRPTKLVLNLNAGFELVFNASTGSEVEWDLEIVCNRPY